MDCSLLGNEEILELPGKCYEGEIRLRQFDMGYTNLLYCKDGIGDEEPVADTLLFANIGGMSHTIAWEQIKELMGKKTGNGGSVWIDFSLYGVRWRK